MKKNIKHENDNSIIDINMNYINNIGYTDFFLLYIKYLKLYNIKYLNFFQTYNFHFFIIIIMFNI